MSNKENLNDRGNKKGQFTQGIGGWAEYTVNMTDVSDTVRHDITLPPKKIIPVIFLPGIMGSNLRMSKKRQEYIKRSDNRAWRPDDMLTKSGKGGVLIGEGFGGWFKLASPEQRQLNFDPDENEVEYYHYTESKERFDPDGKETRESDVRHSNVPDSFPSIAPLMATLPPSSRIKENNKIPTPAQLARWRGWSEVLFSGAYGDMLKLMERLMNNMVENGNIHRYWQTGDSASSRHKDLMKILWQSPTEFGASSGNALCEADLRKIAPCWYPVHAMGYNFLQSNGKSAKVIAERIRGLVKGYRERHFECSEVIIVTHSMGGLLGRALLHSDYGNLANDKDVKILGMYHNVMPTMGAAATYKRMRFGFAEPGMSGIEKMTSRLFGVDGKNSTAVLANSPGALELLPSDAYGSHWLKVVSGLGEFIGSWPYDKQSPSESIYTQSENSWWRLVNPLWVNPANKEGETKSGLEKCYARIEDAYKFTTSLQDTFHPTNCWVSYCVSNERKCYGDVEFAIANIDIYGPVLSALPPPDKWKLLSDDGKGSLIVQAGARKLKLILKQPKDAGDETVPARRSAQLAKGFHFVHGAKKESGYEHQDSYLDQNVLASMLYSIISIAKKSSWK